MPGFHQQVCGNPCNRFAPGIIQPVTAKENHRIGGIGKGAHHLAGDGAILAGQVGPGQEFRQSFRCRSIGVADDIRCIGFQAGFAPAQDDQGGAALGCLFYPQPPQRSFLVQVARNHQDGISPAHILEVRAGSHPHLAHQVTASHGGIENRPALLFTGKAGQVEQVLIRKPAACQHKRVVQFFGCQLQRVLPVRFHQFAIFANQRHDKAMRAFRVLIDHPALVTNPGFVDLLVLAGHDALDDIFTARTRLAPDVDGQVAAHRAVIADGSRIFHLPGAGAKVEIHCCQRSHRADIGGVAGKDRIKARCGMGLDFQ